MGMLVSCLEEIQSSLDIDFPMLTFLIGIVKTLSFPFKVIFLGMVILVLADMVMCYEVQGM